MSVAGEQYGRARVAEIVKAYVRESGTLETDLERPLEVTGSERSPGLRGKDEAVILPQPGLFHPLL